MVYDSSSTDKRRLQDSKGHTVNYDVNGCTIIKECETYQTTEGKMYYGEFTVASLGDGSSCTIGISTCTVGIGTYPHGRLLVDVDGAAISEFKETVAYTGGAGVTQYNLNRRSTETSDVTIVSNPTVSDEGTTIQTSYAGTTITTPSKHGDPGSSKAAFWVLKSNTKYILKVTNTSGGAIKVHIAYLFHEHNI